MKRLLLTLLAVMVLASACTAVGASEPESDPLVADYAKQRVLDRVTERDDAYFRGNRSLTSLEDIYVGRLPCDGHPFEREIKLHIDDVEGYIDFEKNGFVRQGRTGENNWYDCSAETDFEITFDWDAQPEDVQSVSFLVRRYLVVGSERIPLKPANFILYRPAEES